MISIKKNVKSTVDNIGRVGGILYTKNFMFLQYLPTLFLHRSSVGVNATAARSSGGVFIQKNWPKVKTKNID